MAAEFRPDAGNTDAGDLRRFYAQVSRCIGRSLDPGIDRIYLSKPTGWLCRNSLRYMIRCRINDDRWVILKRCLDKPDFIKREQLVASAKSALKWNPSYSVLTVHGVQLRRTSSLHNCAILHGWESRVALMIDAGNIKMAKSLNDLKVSDITDLDWFCFSYGRWAAFNYLFVVHDRNGTNFVLFVDTQTLHSIDNEEGAFDRGGDNPGQSEIVSAMRQNLKRILGPNLTDSQARSFQLGFANGWDAIKRGFPSLVPMLGPREASLMGATLGRDPSSIAAEFILPSL